jgi:hypothetical protein
MKKPEVQFSTKKMSSGADIEELFRTLGSTYLSG